MKKYAIIVSVIAVIFALYFIIGSLSNKLNTEEYLVKKELVPESWDGEYCKFDGITWDESLWVIENGNIYSIDEYNNNSNILGTDMSLSGHYELNCSETECILIDTRSKDEFVFKVSKFTNDDGEFLRYDALGNFWGIYKKIDNTVSFNK